MFQSYTQSVTTEQRVGRRESERQEGEEMVEERVVNGMEVEIREGSVNGMEVEVREGGINRERVEGEEGIDRGENTDGRVVIDSGDGVPPERINITENRKKKLGKRQLHQLRSQQAAAMREKRLRKDLQLSGTESVKGRQLNVCWILSRSLWKSASLSISMN